MNNARFPRSVFNAMSRLVQRLARRSNPPSKALTQESQPPPAQAFPAPSPPAVFRAEVQPLRRNQSLLKLARNNLGRSIARRLNRPVPAQLGIARAFQPSQPGEFQALVWRVAQPSLPDRSTTAQPDLTTLRRVLSGESQPPAVEQDRGGDEARTIGRLTAVHPVSPAARPAPVQRKIPISPRPAPARGTAVELPVPPKNVSPQGVVQPSPQAPPVSPTAAPPTLSAVAPVIIPAPPPATQVGPAVTESPASPRQPVQRVGAVKEEADFPPVPKHGETPISSPAKPSVQRESTAAPPTAKPEQSTAPARQPLAPESEKQAAQILSSSIPTEVVGAGTAQEGRGEQKLGTIPTETGRLAAEIGQVETPLPTIPSPPAIQRKEMPLSAEESPDEGISEREQPVLPPAVTPDIPAQPAESPIILPIASPGVVEGSESVKTLPGGLIVNREGPPSTMEASPPTVTPPESQPTKPASGQQSAIHGQPTISRQPASLLKHKPLQLTSISRQPVFRKVETRGESIAPAGELPDGRAENLPVGSLPSTTSPATTSPKKKPSEKAFESETGPIQRAIYPAWKPTASPIQPRPISNVRATPLHRQQTLVSPPPNRQEISPEDITNPAAIWSAPERRELPLSLPGAMVTQREQYPPRPIARESQAVSIIQRSPAGSQASPAAGAASSTSGSPVTGAVSSTAAQPEVQTGKPSPDLEDLAAKVYQILRRRLRVEIERYRGGM